MAEIIRFTPTPGIAGSKFSQRVYVRELWGLPWERELHLWSEECTWSVFPSMPVASLVWLYGDIMQPGSITFARFLRKEILRVFVKIEYDTVDPDEPLVWIGTIEAGNDRMGGARKAPSPTDPATLEAVATGDQYFTAYGMEWLLATFQILTADVSDAGIVVPTETPPDFNRGGVGNKHPGELAFSNDPELSDTWSSRDIVKYLLKTQTPKSPPGTVFVPFDLDSVDIPDWDSPVIRQQGATTYELLGQLVNQRRGLSARIELTLADALALRTDTFAKEDIDIPLPGASPLPKNRKQLHIIHDSDNETATTIKASSVELYEQVIVRSERRRSVGSFSLHKDSTLERGGAWTDATEATYQAGGSQAPGYSTAGTKEKERLDAMARSVVTLRDVYNYLRIPQTWNRKVGDGEGGPKNPMFPVKDPATGTILPTPSMVFYPDLRVEQSMPLLEGVDYAGNAIANATYVVPEDERKEAAPMAWMKRHGTTTWRTITNIADSADLEITDPSEYDRWSATVRIPADGKGVHLDITGAPKHVLEGLGFTYLDADKRVGKFSYKSPEGGLIVTLSIQDDRYCEGRWPASVVSDESYHKKKLIYADGFRKDYVAPGTVVRTDAFGSLHRSTGGFIPKEADDDDEHKLTAAAKVAAIYYSSVHHVVSLTTYRIQPVTAIRLGALIVKVGDPDLSAPIETNSPVTEISISSPMGTPDSSEAFRMDVSTWAGELDPLLIAPFEPTSEGSSVLPETSIGTAESKGFPGVKGGGFQQ